MKYEVPEFHHIVHFAALRQKIDDSDEDDLLEDCGAAGAENIESQNADSECGADGGAENIESQTVTSAPFSWSIGRSSGLSEARRAPDSATSSRSSSCSSGGDGVIDPILYNKCPWNRNRKVSETERAGIISPRSGTLFMGHSSGR